MQEPINAKYLLSYDWKKKKAFVAVKMFFNLVKLTKKDVNHKDILTFPFNLASLLNLTRKIITFSWIK